MQWTPKETHNSHVPTYLVMDWVSLRIRARDMVRLRGRGKARVRDRLGLDIGLGLEIGLGSLAQGEGCQ